VILTLLVFPGLTEVVSLLISEPEDSLMQGRRHHGRLWPPGSSKSSTRAEPDPRKKGAIILSITVQYRIYIIEYNVHTSIVHTLISQ
jgi:hypothetical protein